MISMDLKQQIHFLASRPKYKSRKHTPRVVMDDISKEIAKQLRGGKVLWLYIVGQLFNIVLTFLAVWMLLSGVIFDIPVLELYK